MLQQPMIGFGLRTRGLGWLRRCAVSRCLHASVMGESWGCCPGAGSWGWCRCGQTSPLVTLIASASPNLAPTRVAQQAPAGRGGVHTTIQAAPSLVLHGIAAICPCPMLSQAVGALLRTLPGCGRAAGAAVLVSSRGIASSAWLSHVEPVRAESEPEAAAQPGTPRWLAELGAIRTDWT